MNHEQAFLADILEHPDDNAPRLIFADWLEDDNHPERAEFIRLQVQAEQTDEYDPGRQALLDRESELLGRKTDQWLGPLKDLLREHGFRRGVLEQVGVRAVVMLDHVEQFQKHPIRDLHLFFMPGEADRAAEVADCPVLAGVQSLSLSGNSGVTTEAIRKLLASPHLGRLRNLDLSTMALSGEGVAAVVASPVAAQLESLNLCSNSLKATAFEMLVAGNLTSLRALLLGGTGLTTAGIDILTSSRRLPALACLDLTQNRLTAPAARMLAHCPRLAGLRELNLTDNNIGGDGAGELARSPHVRRLERLLLRNNGIGQRGVIECAREDFLAHMTYMELSGNAVKTAGIRGLVKGAPARLEYLLLGTCEVDDDALSVLARWPALASLRELNLYNNKVTAFGIRALIDSPHLGRLCHLNLERNDLRNLGAEVLSVWPGLGGVRWLKLRTNGISDRGAVALANSPHLGFMTDLDLSGNSVGDEARAAFQEQSVRARVRRVAPWDVGQVDYHPPFSPQRPRG